MIISGIIFFSTLTIVVGRLAFGRWINHLTLYSFPWGFTLTLFHSGLIQYYPLESETWMLIIGAWLAFLFGSLTIVAVRFADHIGGESAVVAEIVSRNENKNYEPVFLFRALWILNIVLVLHAIYEVHNVIRLMGGNIANIVGFANILYDVRVKEGIPGSIPYFGQLVFLAAVLSGIYTSMVGRLKFVAFVPFLIAIVTSFIQVVRALALVVAILFVCAYFLNQIRIYSFKGSKVFQLLKRGAGVVFLIALLVVTMEVIRTTRGIYEKFSGESTQLKQLHESGSAFISPSVVMYLSVQTGVLNQYLKRDIEHVVWGRYTFAPFWRIISKLGFDTYVGFYQLWFYKTPVTANTGTYIRELHADFGVGGVIVVPYILGLISSIYWFRVAKQNRIADIIILTHVYAVIAMSWFVMLTQLGGWWLSLFVGIIAAHWIDNGDRKKRLFDPAE